MVRFRTLNLVAKGTRPSSPLSNAIKGSDRVQLKYKNKRSLIIERACRGIWETTINARFYPFLVDRIQGYVAELRETE